MRPVARSAAIALPLATTLAFVLPATARPNKPAAASTRYRFSFHVTAHPSGRYGQGAPIAATGSGSFVLGHQLRHGGAKTWSIARPQGSVRITYPEPLQKGGVLVLLQADVVAGTYTTRMTAGGLERTARLKLYPWSAGFACNLSASTRFELQLTELPPRKGNQNTLGLNPCPGTSLAWKASPPKLTIRIAPA